MFDKRTSFSYQRRASLEEKMQASGGESAELGHLSWDAVLLATAPINSG